MNQDKEANFSFDNVFNEKTEYLQYTFDIYKRIYNLPNIEYTGDVSEEMFTYVQKRKFFALLVIYDENGRIFLERNLQEKLYWSLPGGSILKNEDIHSAIRRISERIQTSGDLMVLGEIEPVALIRNNFQYKGNIFFHQGIAFIARIRNLKNINCDDSVGAFIHPNDREVVKINRYANQQVVKLALSRLKFFNTPFPENEVFTNEKYAWRYFFHNQFVKKFILTSRLKKRDKFLEKIKKIIGDADSFLDVSCGDSNIISSINNKRIDYLVANDVSWSQIQSIHSGNKKIIFTNHNAVYLPFKENSFAVAYCGNTLHHMSSKEELVKLLDSIFRVTRKIIIIEIENPNKSSLLPRLLHKYWYSGFLKDVGGAYLSAQDFFNIISSHFEGIADIKFDNFYNIQGNYLIAEISKKELKNYYTNKIIEVEAKYTCHDLDRLIYNCKKYGYALENELVEKDEYFTDINGIYIKDRVCLRLRSNGDYSEITFKGKSNKNTNFYLKEEHNISIPSEQHDAYREMLYTLGYYSYVIVDKKRLVYVKEENNFISRIVIDYLKNIGYFIEFEITYQSGSNLGLEKQVRILLDNIIDRFKSCRLEKAEEPYRDYVATFYAKHALHVGNLKTILFDFDGTIAPSESVFFNAYQNIAKKLLNISISIDDYRKFELNQDGSLFHYLYATLPKNGDVVITEDFFMGEVYAEYEKLFVNMFNNNHLFLNLTGILMLKNRGYKLGLISSSKRKYIDIILKHFKQSDLFDCIITREDVMNLKPNAEPYMLAMEKLSSRAENCLAVEDSKKGIAAASQAGINCVSVFIDSIDGKNNAANYSDHSFMSVLQICLILLYSDYN